jgi:hypothetical protein
MRVGDGLQHLPGVVAAGPDDFGREFLDMIMAARVVDDVEGAMDHIRTYGSQHTEAVIAEDADVVARFFNGLDSAILMHNASTQFADGGEFGLGAEIGIATGKMHARGPVGAEQLTSFKYLGDRGAMFQIGGRDQFARAQIFKALFGNARGDFKRHPLAACCAFIQRQHQPRLRNCAAMVNRAHAKTAPKPLQPGQRAPRIGKTRLPDKRSIPENPD